MMKSVFQVFLNSILLAVFPRTRSAVQNYLRIAIRSQIWKERAIPSLSLAEKLFILHRTYLNLISTWVEINFFFLRKYCLHAHIRSGGTVKWPFILWIFNVTRIYGHLRWAFFSPFGYGRVVELFRMTNIWNGNNSEGMTIFGRNDKNPEGMTKIRKEWQ